MENLNVWKNALQSLFSKEPAKDGKERYHGKKHEIIRKAYAQRQQLKNGSHLSLSLPTPSFQLAEGLNLASETSAEFNTSFAEAIPRLVLRRGAIHELDMKQNAEFQRPSSRICIRQSVTSQSGNSQSYLSPDKKKSKRKRFLETFNKKSRRRRSSMRLSISSISNQSQSSFRPRRYSTSDSIGMSDGGEAIALKRFKKLSKSNSSLARSVSSLSEMLHRADLASLYSDFHFTKSVLATASVQTSFTDLSTVGRSNIPTTKPKMVTTGTQYDPPSTGLAITSSSSSQAESQPPLKPLEPNVIRISVTHHQNNSGEDSSSIPSSFDRDVHTSTKKLLNKENVSSSSMSNEEEVKRKRPFIRELHNRARRGGIVDLSGIELVTTKAQTEVGELAVKPL